MRRVAEVPSAIAEVPLKRNWPRKIVVEPGGKLHPQRRRADVRVGIDVEIESFFGHLDVDLLRLVHAAPVTLNVAVYSPALV